MIRYCREHNHLYEGSSCPECSAEIKATFEEEVIIGGQDLAKHRDHSALVVLEIKGGKGKLKGLKLWPHVDYQTVIADTEHLYHKTGMRILGVDATSIGDPIIEIYNAKGMTIEPVEFTAKTKNVMVETMRAAMQQGTLVLPNRGAEELRAQVAEQELIVGATETPKYEGPAGRHDDLFWALGIACYVARDWLLGNGVWVERNF